MIIRRFREDDRSDVIALWHDAGLVVRPKNDPEADIDLCLRYPNAALLVGTTDDRIMASVMACHDAHRGWLYYLAVASHHRRHGYGRQLVAAAEQWHRDQGIPKSQLMIRETNAEVAAFYARLGYEAIPRVAMQKVL